jgi:hypothetical protein
MAGNPYGGMGLADQSRNAYTQALGTNAGMAGVPGGPGPLARTNLSPYMNPFTQSVVNTTMGELGRQQQIQGNSLADQATKQGAFGGDRFAIQQAENDRNWNAQKANTLSGLYNTGFNNAQQAAQGDIQTQIGAANNLGNLSNMGFGMGQQLQQNQLAAGAMQQSQMQKVMDAIKGQYQGYTGQGAQGLNNMISALQGMFNPNVSKSSASGSSKNFGMPSISL